MNDKTINLLHDLQKKEKKLLKEINNIKSDKEIKNYYLKTMDLLTKYYQKDNNIFLHHFTHIWTHK